MKRAVCVGVLALQGAFAKHHEVLVKLGVKSQLVRYPEQLDKCDALIIPGGESTTMLRSIERMELKDALCSFAKSKPIFGTCAGVILMASKEINDLVTPLGIIDITVERNAYGGQYESFSDLIKIKYSPKRTSYLKGTFIRAPKITNISSDVTVLAEYNGSPVLVQQGKHLCATFHPELSDDDSVHRYFLKNLSVR